VYQVQQWPHDPILWTQDWMLSCRSTLLLS